MIQASESFLTVTVTCVFVYSDDSGSESFHTVTVTCVFFIQMIQGQNRSSLLL